MPRRIAIVEDDPAIRANYADALGKHGYEVAVYGDRASALVNAERALRLGVEPTWFRFPWFDPLRTSAEFQYLLKRPARTAPAPA